MDDIIDGKILKKYEFVKKIGKGAYGQVWKVISKRRSNRICAGTPFTDQQGYKALKKVGDCFKNVSDCQRIYREITYLQHLHHPNIVKLQGYEKAVNDRDIYIEMQCMESDLSTVLKNRYLNGVQKKYIFVQVVSALYYLHSAELIHRDLKPSNILIGPLCEAKICDFGLVRSVYRNSADIQLEMSENIATRWYKAPELLLGASDYSKGVDIWGLGCLLGQILLDRPLFQGISTFNQLETILKFVEKPIHIHNFIHSSTAIAVFDSIPSLQKQLNKQPLQQLLPNIDPTALNLLKGLLQFDPSSRLTIQDVIKHPYISQTNKYTQKIKFIRSEKPIIIEGDIHIDQIPILVQKQKSFGDFRNRSLDKLSSKNKLLVEYFKGLLFDGLQEKDEGEPETNGSQSSSRKIQINSTRIASTSLDKKAKLQNRSPELKNKQKIPHNLLRSRQKISIANSHMVRKIGSHEKTAKVSSPNTRKKPSFLKQNNSQDKNPKKYQETNFVDHEDKNKKRRFLNEMIEKDQRQIDQSEILKRYWPMKEKSNILGKINEEKEVGMDNQRATKRDTKIQKIAHNDEREVRLTNSGNKNVMKQQSGIMKLNIQPNKQLGKQKYLQYLAMEGTKKKHTSFQKTQNVLSKINSQPKIVHQAKKQHNTRQQPVETTGKLPQSINKNSHLSSSKQTLPQSPKYFPLKQYPRNKKPSLLSITAKNRSGDSLYSNKDFSTAIESTKNIMSSIQKIKQNSKKIQSKMENSTSFDSNERETESIARVDENEKGKREINGRASCFDQKVIEKAGSYQDFYLNGKMRNIHEGNCHSKNISHINYISNNNKIGHNSNINRSSPQNLHPKLSSPSSLRPNNLPSKQTTASPSRLHKN